MVTDARFVQASKAASLIVVTELGISIDVNPSQYLKAHFPIDVTELGMVTDVNPEH